MPTEMREYLEHLRVEMDDTLQAINRSAFEPNGLIIRHNHLGEQYLRAVNCFFNRTYSPNGHQSAWAAFTHWKRRNNQRFSGEQGE